MHDSNSIVATTASSTLMGHFCFTPKATRLAFSICAKNLFSGRRSRAFSSRSGRIRFVRKNSQCVTESCPVFALMPCSANPAAYNCLLLSGSKRCCIRTSCTPRSFLLHLEARNFLKALIVSLPGLTHLQPLNFSSPCRGPLVYSIRPATCFTPRRAQVGASVSSF